MAIPTFSFGLVSGVSSTFKLMHFNKNQKDPAGPKRVLMIHLWEIQFILLLKLIRGFFNITTNYALS